MEDSLLEMLSCHYSEMVHSKSDVLSAWRSLGFLAGLKEGGVVEWRCAKSFDLMARYLMEDSRSEDELRWEVMVFPFLRKCASRYTNRITRVVSPEEVFGFLSAKTIGDLLSRMYGVKMDKCFKYLVECFGRYVDGERGTPLVRLLSLFDAEGIERLNKVFGIDFEAEVCSAVCDYFCECVKRGE